MEEARTAFEILTGKLTLKRPLRKPMRRWEENIRIDSANMKDWID